MKMFDVIIVIIVIIVFEYLSNTNPFRKET